MILRRPPNDEDKATPSICTSISYKDPAVLIQMLAHNAPPTAFTIHMAIRTCNPTLLSVFA